MQPHLKQVVIQTVLSRKPRRGSALVATLGTAALFLVSGLAARDPWAFSADAPRVFSEHHYWLLLTSLLLHRDLPHLLANALPWWGFSFLLYGYFGPLVFPVGVLLFGAMVNGLSTMTYSEGTRLIGASGAVYLMGGFWLTLYLLIDRRYRLRRRLLHASGFVLALMAPQSLDPATSYRTHLIGFFCGVVWGSVYFLRKRKSIREAEILELED